MKRIKPVSTISLLLVMMMMSICVAGQNQTDRPCDIYAAAGCPCVAAHSTTRTLYKSYNGPLYQVMRQSDGKVLDIGLIKGGYADAAAQDAFCVNTIGWITKIYDQSGKGNHLMQAPPGTFKGPEKGGFNTLPIADMAPITISGHKVYGVYIIPGMGLRNNDAKGIAINDEPEGIYYVINGKHFDSGCCFDYGNSSTNGRAVGTGTMETTYYGISTAWGSGNGSGPWIMADMEAGLFSGYNAKKNDVPSIDSWQFVSAFVDGGGGNKWDLRGGNAQQGNLTTFYSGVRPGTPNSNAYFPMNKKGGILLGNGGDNGNGSAGTFYEGVMTTGFPNEATTDAVQANIVAAKYDVQRMSMSRLTTFTPKSTQNVTVKFTNTTGTSATGVKLSIAPRQGWSIREQSSSSNSKIFPDPIAPGATVSATFTITSPQAMDNGFLTAKTEWKNSQNATVRSDSYPQRIRNVAQIKINEVRFGTGDNATNQFIELYNASSNEVDISNWSLISTASGWSSISTGKIPVGTKLAANSFYLLGLSSSGLIAPANAGENIIRLQSVTGFEVGQPIDIDGEKNKIANMGTAATAATTLFIPVSTGPWLNFPVGTNNFPVTSTSGFAIGQKIGIDIGGNYEIATVTKVGKAATQTNLATEAKSGDITIKVLDNLNISVGDILTISTGARKEKAEVKRIITVATPPSRGNAGSPGEIELDAPLKFDHMKDVDVAGPGTGISFTPATRFKHKSGEAIQALGSGITLESKLTRNHKTGSPVSNSIITTQGYQGSIKPNQWYGLPLSASAGSIALMDATGKMLIDGIVYGSQQSNSSANGTIASPEIATLEGEQIQGGCIMVVPAPPRNPFQPVTTDLSNRSFGRFPDGYDSDNNCRDFQFQNSVALSAPSAAGSNNIKVSGVTGFNKDQKIIIGTGNNSESVTIAEVGAAGGTKILTATDAGATTISVSNVTGFTTGQLISIGNGSNVETATIATIIPARRRFDNSANRPTDSISITAPLKLAHPVNTEVTGSGITFTTPLTKGYDSGTPVAANIPTPGATNQYSRKL